MTLVPVNYRPGTDKGPQKTSLTSTCFTETDKVHFPDGLLRTIDHYADVTPTTAMYGAARALYGVTFTGTYKGDYLLTGTHSALYSYKNVTTVTNITPLQTSGTTLTNNPIATTNTLATVVVTHNAHGMSAGDRVKLSGASDVGGITAATYINKEHIITSVTTNTYILTLGATASSTATGGGASVVEYQQIADGYKDFSLGYGYGMGLYGVGRYGVAKTAYSAATVAIPRIWSFDTYGNTVVMCPGDYVAGDGQKIYSWDGNTDTAPTVLSGAPTDCNYVYVSGNAVTALCGNVIKKSSIGASTSWTVAAGSSAYQATVQRIPRLIAGVEIEGNQEIIFAEQAVFLLRYVGEPQYYLLSEITTDDGLIAPNAFCKLHGVVYWMGLRGWYRYSPAGGFERLRNSQNEDYFYRNLNAAQQFKIFAVADTNYGQVWWHAPLLGNNEPSHYVIAAPDAEGWSWTLGTFDRTAAIRPGFLASRFYYANSDGTNPVALYRHFLDTSSSCTLNATARTAYTSFAEQGRARVMGVLPDTEQDGDMTVTIYTKEYPQSIMEYSSAYTLTETQEKVHTKDSGRQYAIGFSSNTAGGAFTLGAWRVDLQQQGARV